MDHHFNFTFTVTENLRGPLREAFQHAWGPTSDLSAGRVATLSGIGGFKPLARFHDVLSGSEVPEAEALAAALKDYLDTVALCETPITHEVKETEKRTMPVSDPDATWRERRDEIFRHIVGRPADLTIWGTPREPEMPVWHTSSAPAGEGHGNDIVLSAGTSVGSEEVFTASTGDSLPSESSGLR